MSKLGFRRYLDNQQWDENSKYDDNTYPEIILNTKKLTTLEGSNFQSLREDLNRFNKNYDINVEKFTDLNFSKIKDLFSNWVKSMNIRNGLAEKQLIESTKILFTSKYNIINYLIKDSRKDKVVGWMNFSECSQRCLGFNVLVNDFEYYNLYRIAILKACMIANELGYKCINIQGSEDYGQFTSKLRMKPESQVKKIHMLYN